MFMIVFFKRISGRCEVMIVVGDTPLQDSELIVVSCGREKRVAVYMFTIYSIHKRTSRFSYSAVLRSVTRRTQRRSGSCNATAKDISGL